MLDYETLKLIWWLIVGVVLIGFAIMDGHDMGVGSLLPLLGKNDNERRIIINSVAPHWDGNQVWFITAGAGTFAAWPVVYSIAFSGLYWAMLLLLAALFFRPVGFEYRSKIATPRWRKNWDWGIFVGSAIPSLLFGVAFGNLLLGIPFQLDDTMRSTYTGNFFQLLHPFALICGVVSLSLLIFQGATFLAHRTEGELQLRVKKTARLLAIILLITFSSAGVWMLFLKGIVIDNMPNPNDIINPLMKTAHYETGAWLNNYKAAPILWLIPALVYVMILTTIGLQITKHTLLAFVTSSLAVACTILTAAVALFPFVLPSNTHPGMSITLWDGSSSYYTLMVMLIVVLIFVPMILTYTAWSYHVMRGKLTVDYIEANDKTLY